MAYTLLVILCLILAACICGNMIRIADEECEIGEDDMGDRPNVPSISHRGEIIP